MKNRIQALFTLLILLATTQVNALSHISENTISNIDQKIIKTHNAIRSVSLRIRMKDDLHGIIESKNCSFCKTIKIKITPNTKAFANNISVPLRQAENRMGRYATIVYELKTNKVSTIRW